MLEGGKPIAYGARYPNFLIKTYCSNKEPWMKEDTRPFQN
jgi:hypothetical protein